jgi:hypothetical protein
MGFRDGSKRNSIKFSENLGKREAKTLAMIRQAFGEDGVSRTQEVQTQRNRKRWNKWRTKSIACSSFSLTPRGLFTKKHSWQAKQSFPHTTLMFYGDWVPMCKESPQTLGTKELAVASRHAPTHSSFFTREFFTKNNMTDCFPDWRQNWKAAILTQLRSRQNIRRCWTPSQKTTSGMQYKTGRSAENGAYARKATTSRVMVASRPEVSYWPDGSISPGNYGWHFVELTEVHS